MKLKQTGEPNWVALGEGAGGPVVVLVVESNPQVTLKDVFGRPPLELGQD